MLVEVVAQTFCLYMYKVSQKFVHLLENDVASLIFRESQWNFHIYTAFEDF